MRLTPAGALVLVAFSVPVAVELRTFFGFFGLDLPLVSVAIFEAVLLAAIGAAYLSGPDASTTAAQH